MTAFLARKELRDSGPSGAKVGLLLQQVEHSQRHDLEAHRKRRLVNVEAGPMPDFGDARIRVRGPKQQETKVAGSKDGITALQMDIKITGVTPQIMAEALAQAKAGLLEVLLMLV